MLSRTFANARVESLAGVVWRPTAMPAAKQLSSRWWLASLGVLLAGYAFAGRGFAHIGAKPLYIGEVLLLTGVLFVLPNSTRLLLRPTALKLCIGFATLGALRTFPFIEKYGVDSLRDGALWGYCTFALLVFATIARRIPVFRLVQTYRRWITPFLIWAPIGVALRLWPPAWLPRVPGSNVPIIDVKGGDTAVHLAGILAFFLLGLHRPWRGQQTRNGKGVPESLCYTFWIVCVVLVTTGRGALLTVLTSLVAVLVICEKTHIRWARPMLIVSAIVLVLAVTGVSIKVPGRDRRVSLGQMARNAASIIDNSGRADLDGTREWRLAWWREIISYTVHGDYFWQGKGFGVNLAADDGFQLSDESDLRSPHNGHLTVLARMGVPGLLVWIALQLSFGAALLQAHLQARKLREHWWAHVDLWILAYWLAFLVNGGFDVFLEGPQGGIWFWCVFGFGLATVAQQRRYLCYKAMLRVTTAHTRAA